MTLTPPSDDGVIAAGTAVAACTPGQRRAVLLVAILGSGLAFIDGSSVNVALPALQAGLGATVVQVQWIINAYTLVLAALILPGGSLGDRLGRARVFAAGVAVFSAASLWCALAPSINHLIAARAFQGLGGALLVPGSLALISASFPEGSRGRAIGLWSGFASLTAAAGPVLAGWLIDTLSWRWIFVINLPIGAVVIAVTLTAVPESRDPDATRIDWRGVALVAAGLAGLTYGLLQAESHGFGDARTASALAAGIVLLAAFVWWERRATAPIVPLRLFASPIFAGANLLTLLMYGALGGALFFLPLDLIQVEGYSATEAGAVLLPFVLLMFVLSRWAGGLTARYGTRPPLVVGPLVAALGFLLFAWPLGGGYWAGIFPAVVVLGLGMAITVAPLTTTVMNAVPPTHSGTASGINNAVARVAGLLFLSIMGIVMLWIFGAALEANLALADLPAAARTALLAHRTDLAAIAMPPGLDLAQQQAVTAAVDVAFRTGYRTVMTGAAVLALLSAATAALMIRDAARRAATTPA